MSNSKKAVLFRGRFLGIVVLSGIQLLIGLVHTFFGAVLLLGSLPVASFSDSPTVYSVYTLCYGLSTLLFAVLLWKEKRLGWIGTVAVSLFVIFADTLTVFDLVPFLGIIKTAAIGEIPYSILVVIYLIQEHVTSRYKIK